MVHSFRAAKRIEESLIKLARRLLEFLSYHRSAALSVRLHFASSKNIK